MDFACEREERTQTKKPTLKWAFFLKLRREGSTLRPPLGGYEPSIIIF